HGKSFLALDWALSIAHGGQWHGHEVKQGAVIYVAAEGGRSIQRRVVAWMNEHRVEKIPRAFFLLEAVQIRNPEDLELLAARMEALNVEPLLIVIDTLARSFGGGDENKAQEMGEYINGLEWLKTKAPATMMVLHHTGKKAEDEERGSSALRA